MICGIPSAPAFAYALHVANVFELQGASKRYGAQQALSATDLEVPGGETVVLIGPSGCGKSTLLRLLAGLQRPDTGRVLFRGAAPGPEQRRGLGYVVQGGGLFPHLTAEQNATLLARFLGWDEARVRSRLSELVELTRFPPRALERYPAQLSGGQAQRVSLLRALFLDPAALLLDEPLGALDPITRFELQRDLRDVFERLRKTVVLVTHDLGEAAFFAGQRGRIVLLRDGRIVQQGSLSDLLHAPAEPFVSQFVAAQRPPPQGAQLGPAQLTPAPDAP